MQKGNSQKKEARVLIHRLLNTLKNLVYAVLLFSAGFLIYAAFGESIKKSMEKPPLVQSSAPGYNEDWDKVENGIHVETGLIYADGFDLVRGTCTACHSAKLVTQNRASREGWQQMIEWMQETQGLWDLGPNEPKILDYLAEHYAPDAIGRRANINIKEVEWYILELNSN